MAGEGKVNDLNDFYKELVEYSNLAFKDDTHWLTVEERGRVAELNRILGRKIGYLGDLISELSRMRSVNIGGSKSDMWSVTLKLPLNPLVVHASLICVQATNRAIGKLEYDIQKGIRDEQGNIIGKPPKDTTESPANLFDKMQFHPKVVEASKSCFIASNYREAILNAFICLIDCVKERTGLDLDGDDLMNQAFSFNYDKEQRRITKYPIIRLNELKNKSDLDEQQGFMFLCKGAVGGIRNPKAHKIIPQSNPLHTLEFLAFASLLIKKVEEGTVVKTSLPRTKWDWDRFLADTKSKCELEIVRLAVNLYDFTRSNSDFISWGTGNQDGSFTFRKLGLGGMISIFSMYSYGWVYINFSSMKNKNVPDSIMESFKDNLNNIPNINIPKEVVSNGKYARIYEKPLTNYDNLKIFQDAVISLCQQLENSKE